MQSLAGVSLCMLAILVSPAALRAQEATVEAPTKPPIVEVPSLFKPGWRDKRYAVPDLAPDRILMPKLNTPILTIRPGMEFIVDHTGFRQDTESIAQVGPQHDVWEVRSASLEFNGEIGLKRRLDYKLGIEYNGFDVNPDKTWAVTDVNVGFAIPRWRTRVRLGQMREDFGYEVVGSLALMPQSERIISPFASPNNFGLKVTHLLGAGDRATISYGIFKDSWGEGDGRPAISARATMLAIDRPDRWLHVGIAVRRADIGSSLQYKATPGVAAADNFVDTGEFAASAATHLGLELNYSSGPWSVIAEYASARPDIPVGQDPVFRGYYILGSWVPTGEQREYDRSKAALKRIIPKGRWGAPELVARYAAVDLSSGSIDGGRYDRIEVGANWWATTRWKFGMLYGHVWLRRFGETGHTQTLLTRLQWVY